MADERRIAGTKTEHEIAGNPAAVDLELRTSDAEAVAGGGMITFITNILQMKHETAKAVTNNIRA